MSITETITLKVRTHTFCNNHHVIHWSLIIRYTLIGHTSHIGHTPHTGHTSQQTGQWSHDILLTDADT